MKKSKWIVAVVLSGAMLTPAAFAGSRAQRVNKVSAVSFRLASANADSGFRMYALPSGRVVYISAEDAFTSAEVAGMEASPSDNGQVLSVSLTPGTSERLAMRTADTGADSVAIFRGGRVVAAGSIDSIGIDVTIITGLTAAESARVQRLVATRSLADASTVVSVVAQQDIVAPGDVVTVDVYVSNVQSLRTYQFALTVSDGDTGELTRDHGVVDATNGSFVFGSGQMLQAVDQIHGRFGAVLFHGGADVTTPRYLGSYTYQVSPDASGMFTISVTPGDISFLNSVAGAELPFRTLPAKVIVE